MSYALGIDLGTTFSAAAVARAGQAELLSLGYRSPTLPSVIVARETGEILIGEAAERRSMIEPLRTAREFKRRLGDPTPILLGSAPYGAETLTSYLLRGIYDLVIEQTGEPPASLVISHPANWGLYKLDLLEQAVRMADVGDARYITEPVAAALHYAGRERIEPGEIVAVYDFGGGTFDAALLRRTEQSFEPLGEPEGIERLGGIDFDEAVFGHVMQSISDQVGELDPADSTAMAAVARLRDECRQAKEVLSVDTDVTIPVMLPGVQTEIRLTRSEFEEMVEPRIGSTIDALLRAIRSAGIEMGDVDRILLVGGSSRIPLVRQQVRDETESEIFLDAHPKYAIALGAAIAADLNLGTTIAAQMRTQSEPTAPANEAASQPPSSQPSRPVARFNDDYSMTGATIVEPPKPAPSVSLENEEAAPATASAPIDSIELETPPLAPTPAVDDVTAQPEEPVPADPPVEDPAPQIEVDTPAVVSAASVRTETGELPVPAVAERVASSQWQDGIALSPVLIAALVAAALGSAAGMFLILSLVVD